MITHYRIGGHVMAARKKKIREDQPRETVYLNTVTRDQLTLLLDKYPRRSKSDLINAAIEHLFLSGYETGLDGNLLPINPQVYRVPEKGEGKKGPTKF